MEELWVDSIQKQYDGKVVLSDVFLKVKKGQIVGILGRNGSGKSTLMKIVFGCCSVDFGFLRCNNKVFKKGYKNKIVGYASQKIHLPKHLKVTTVLKIALSKAQVKQAAENKVLSTVLCEKIENLSYGIQRYLQVYLLLKDTHQVCLLDEPFSGIAPLFLPDIKQLISEARAGKIILITDHNYLELVDWVDEIKLLKDSKLYHLQNKEALVTYGYLSSL